MLANRSMPRVTVIPVLGYDDVPAAVDWLQAAFGFTLRWQAGAHRAQLKVGDGVVVVTARADGSPSPGAARDVSVMVRVDDVDAHAARARAHGAAVVQEPSDFPYGERQYAVDDPGGHRWTFSQSIADVAPEEWGAVSGLLG